jgi:hypothetical protein
LLLASAALGACSSTPAPAAHDGGPDATANPSGDAGEAADASDGGALDADDAVDAGTVTLATDSGTPIPPFAFGHNYWDWVDYGGGTTGLAGTAPLVSALHLNVMRAGGDNNDSNSPELFDTSQIDSYVAYCRSVGAEPILQVPLVANNIDGGPATPDTAAAMVSYANVTMGYGIQYWEIGNEPDLYATQYDAGVPTTAADYCSVFQTYAAAMKTANAAGPDGGVTIKLLGPELSSAYTPGNDWLTPFLDGCANDVDIVTVHRYPFSGTETTLVNALNDVLRFRQTVGLLQGIVAGHARPGTPLAITETNISYLYATSSYSGAGLVAAPGTFPAALWTADLRGAALEANLWTLAFFDLGELPGPDDLLGFIAGGVPVPAYYAEQLISANFRGDLLSPLGVPTGYSVYAAHDPALASTAIAVINKTSTTGRLSFAVDAQPAQAFDFPALSVSLVQLPDAPDAGAHLTQYTSAQADAGVGPVIVR